MSLVFNDTTTYKGIVQIYEKEIGMARGGVSGNTTLLKELTADVNLALDDFWALAIPASGTWQLDDTNHTDYPEISTNLVAGRRDYKFTTDEQNNLILDIYSVWCADESGIYRKLIPVDKQSEEEYKGFHDGQNTTGVPTRYDKTANGFFLDAIPSYNYTNGLKVEINREASYFTSTDTTKKAGIAGIFHKYLALKPAHDYARRHNLTNVDRLGLEIQKMERDIQEYYGRRSRDEQPKLTVFKQNNR